MAVDFEEAFARVCWWLPRRLTFYLSAVWVACMIGGASAVAGRLFAGMKPGLWIYLELLASPVLLASGWFCANAIVLGIAFVIFLRRDALSIRAWGIFAGVQSLFAVLGAVLNTRSNGEAAVVWLTWLLLLVMMETAVWFLRQWQHNRWAGELAMLKAENAVRRRPRPNDAPPEEPLDLP